MKTGNASTVDCGVCCREIPLDAAFTPEGADYVMHFCGLDCYRRFTERAAHDRPGSCPEMGATLWVVAACPKHSAAGEDGWCAIDP